MGKSAKNCYERGHKYKSFPLISSLFCGSALFIYIFFVPFGEDIIHTCVRDAIRSTRDFMYSEMIVNKMSVLWCKNKYEGNGSERMVE